MAVAFPILPGKTEEWRSLMEELNGSRREQFAESRRRAGVHERTFLQPTPMGDLVIVTLEGDDPEHAFGRMIGADDEFTKWFLERVQAGHGVDLAVPLTGRRRAVIDSERRRHGSGRSRVASHQQAARCGRLRQDRLRSGRASLETPAGDEIP
jgi:hypothetical protein